MKKETKQKARNIGIDVKAPKTSCNDRHCAFHGNIKLRGRTFIGTVISTDLNNTARVEWKRSGYIQKYERYELKRSRLKVHNPECIGAKKGDKVKVMESRPISKTKNFVIIEKMEEDNASS